MDYDVVFRLEKKESDFNVKHRGFGGFFSIRF